LLHKKRTAQENIPEQPCSLTACGCYSSEIAPTGHTEAQDPQLTQLSALI